MQRVKRCLLSCVLVGMVAGYTNAGVYPPDIQRILDRGKLIVAMYYKDIPPFFMHVPPEEVPANARCVPAGENFFCGVDVELALDIADRLHVECEFERSAETFDAIIDVLSRHEADVAITLLSRTLDRSLNVLFTRPYVVLYTGFLFNRLALANYSETDSLKKILDHPAATIGSKEGNSWIDYARALFPQARIQEYPSWDPEVIAAVRKGEVMAAYADEMEIKKVIIGKPAVAIELKTIIIKDVKDSIAMAVPWDSPHLQAWLNTYLEERDVSMTADAILKKYPESVKGAAEQEVSVEDGE